MVAAMQCSRVGECSHCNGLKPGNGGGGKAPWRSSFRQQPLQLHELPQVTVGVDDPVQFAVHSLLPQLSDMNWQPSLQLR